MQYPDLMKSDEDWRGLRDPSERRKIQNRIAQRAYRRNIRESSNEIKQLKERLRSYEESRLNIAEGEDSTCQQSSSSPPILPPTKRGVEGWCPPKQATLPVPVAPSEERYKMPFPNDSQFSHVQPQICPAAPIDRQPVNSPRPATQQRMKGWTPTNSQITITEPLAPTPNLPMESRLRFDDMLPLSSANVSATMHETFAFDMAEPVNKSQRPTSLLHMAVAGNHIETIKVLLQDDRVMIDDEDSDGFTALQRAVMSGKSEIVKLLLEHSADTGPSEEVIYL
ncbi:uncharacterized protein GIQ15_07011 [Arthroderma uncinatum]|uniref:uncharacterized protein n=1 Tax=Arthroderma uncinatum TaxID=74035 RepID=UPI00144AC18C|nr:uncharacterized protein GIQ15_07011 [Arthroderma uncinatum]KAF3480035.1 hypothetical protein GIQ15_07011 [Arthroderma uncinatum]